MNVDELGMREMKRKEYYTRDLENLSATSLEYGTSGKLVGPLWLSAVTENLDHDLRMKLLMEKEKLSELCSGDSLEVSYVGGFGITKARITKRKSWAGEDYIEIQ